MIIVGTFKKNNKKNKLMICIIFNHMVALKVKIPCTLNVMYVKY